MIKDVRKYFPFFTHNKEVTYLDSAASSLKLNSVIDEISNYYATNGTNVYRGVYSLSHEATKKYEETRTLVAKYINCFKDEVIFTKGTTDSLNSLSQSLSNIINKDDEVITSELEHHSSLIPWQVLTHKKLAKLVYVPLSNEGKITVSNILSVLTNKTKVVALTHVSNALGYKTPIKDIVRAIRAFNKEIIIILDAAQSISHENIDVKDLDIDFMAFSAHKMYGPTGVGVLYGKKELLDQIPPFAYGGEMANIVNKDNSTYKETPYKFEAGTPNIAGVIGFGAALKFLLSLNMNEVYNYEMSLKDELISKMKENNNLIIYNESARTPIITFNVKGVHPHDIASVLDQRLVYIRAGHHCAQLVSERIETISTLRVSIAIYNNKEDLNRFLRALNEAIDFFKGFE